MRCVDHRLGSLLARWHQWRRHYSHERGYAHPCGPSDPEDELEAMLMDTIEIEVLRMPVDLQRALQHLARAECLGVDIAPTDGGLYAQALHRMRVALIHAGVL